MLSGVGMLSGVAMRSGVVMLSGVVILSGVVMLNVHAQWGGDVQYLSSELYACLLTGTCSGCILSH